jgi:lysophospholipase L1-like esterase
MLPLPFEDQLTSAGTLMAEDGFHPSPAVYALWAEQLAGKISGEVVPLLPQTTPTRRKD